MQSMFTVAIACALATMLLAQQVADDISADKRVRSFAFAKRSPYRQFAFAKRSAEEEDEGEVEKRARFAFAKRCVRPGEFRVLMAIAIVFRCASGGG
ncbi:hypothetical protein OESDEN_23531 [Oesophagostomum dentatum]|uniref:Uncharacterized protein n=1 Tax=Oesophagostomum dentatum TaxID=61180 RepID=A0A0B1RVY0_OESDE|nr:hypothetical protein OESDEN_23531 [Oesophagostomum dentatum]